MAENDLLEQNFRRATRELEEAPIRWERVARIARRKRVLAVVGLVLVVSVMTTLIAGGVLAGKSAVDPEFQPPFIGGSIESAEGPKATSRAKLGHYLRDMGVSTRGLTPSEFNEEGYVVRVRVTLRGLRGRRITVRWSMYDARSSRRLPGPIYNQMSGSLAPRAATHSRTFPVWVPYPPRPGRYYIRLSLTNDKGTLIDRGDSAPFVVRSVPDP